MPPIFTEDDTPPAKVVEPVKVQPKEFKGVTVDTKEVRPTTLTTYLEGQSWIVDYYSQVLGADNGTQGLQLDLDAVYQQYRLVRGMELKVNSPLSPSQNDNTKEMSLTGTATVYWVMIPNVGDMFIADLGDGREGLLQVEASRRKTIYNETAHEIDYKVVSLTNEPIYENLKKKTVETLFFSREMLHSGFNPMISEGDLDLTRKLENHFPRLTALYFNDFYSREHNTLIVPNQAKVTYDPYLTKFIMNVLTSSDHPSVRHVSVLNVYNDQNMYEMTLWNCLETMDIQMLPMLTQKMGILPVAWFKTQPLFNSIYYSRVKAVIYPTQSPTNVDAGYAQQMLKSTDPYSAGARRFKELDRLISDTTLVPDTPVDDDSIPLIYPVTQDNYYIFTKAFYQYDETVGKLSVLENQVRRALSGQSLDLSDLDKLCSAALKWNNLERFYYIPILLTLLKVYPRGL